MTFTATRRSFRAVGVVAAGAALALVAVAGPAAAVDGPPAYYPDGPQTNVNQADLAGWTLCYSGPYSEDNVALYGPGGIIDELCTGDYLMLAAGPVDNAILTLLAAAPRVDVLTDTQDDFTTTHPANGSEWYFNDNRSWGFALGGDTVNKDSCDYGDNTNLELRLCFHANSQMLMNGYRAGANVALGASWTRYIYQSNGTPAPALAATGVNVTAPVIAAGGLLVVGALAVAFMASARRRTAG